jgi:hypothetical protein
MADKSLLEQMLERLVNDDQAKAEELFHEYVVAKSREIYENLIEAEMTDDEDDTGEAGDTDVEEDFENVAFEGDSVIYAEAPRSVELEVTYTEPGVKGDTATKTLKPATLETGATINIPLFINIGEKIKVDTRTGEYMERVK